MTDFKVIILGDSHVGKTSILKWFDNNNSQEKNVRINQPKATVRPDLWTIPYTFTFKDGKEKQIKLNIWDTVGQEAQHALTSQVIRDADVVIFCFKYNNEQSLCNLKKWKNMVKRKESINFSRLFNWRNRSKKNDEDEIDIDLGNCNFPKKDNCNDNDNVQDKAISNPHGLECFSKTFDDDNFIYVKPNCFFYVVGNQIDLSNDLMNILKENMGFLTSKKKSELIHESNESDTESDKSVNFILTLKLDNHNLKEEEDQTKIITNKRFSIHKVQRQLQLKKILNAEFDSVVKNISFNYIQNNLFFSNNSINNIGGGNRATRKRSISISYKFTPYSSSSSSSSLMFSPNSSSSSSSTSIYEDNKDGNNDLKTKIIDTNQVISSVAQEILTLGYDHDEIFFVSAATEKCFGLEHLFEFICVDLINFQLFVEKSVNNKQQQQKYINQKNFQNADKIILSGTEKKVITKKQECCF